MINSKYDNNQRSISSKKLPRITPKIEIFVHELIRIKQEIVDGIPLSRALIFFWSCFCLIFGNVITDFLSKEIFSIDYFVNIHPFVLSLLVITASLSFVLWILKKPKSSAIKSIDEILNQCGYQE